ncbi:MAG: hypothetical protein AVDCRST_MAG16-1817, partial [uncultured Frankineae bacterium]
DCPDDDHPHEREGRRPTLLERRQHARRREEPRRARRDGDQGPVRARVAGGRPRQGRAEEGGRPRRQGRGHARRRRVHGPVRPDLPVDRPRLRHQLVRHRPGLGLLHRRHAVPGRGGGPRAARQEAAEQGRPAREDHRHGQGRRRVGQAPDPPL